VVRSPRAIAPRRPRQFHPFPGRAVGTRGLYFPQYGIIQGRSFSHPERNRDGALDRAISPVLS